MDPIYVIYLFLLVKSSENTLLLKKYILKFFNWEDWIPTSVCNASDSIRACSTYILLQDRNLSHIHTHTLGPFMPLTSAKWQLHQGGHGSSKKTIAFSVNEHAYVSDEAFIIYPNKIFSFFLFFLKSVFSSGSLEKDLAVVLVVALHPLTPFLSQSKGIKHGHRREKFPIAKSFMQLRWALQRFFCPIQMSWSKQKKKIREVSFRAIG